MEPGDINFDEKNVALEKEILGPVQGAPEQQDGGDIFAPPAANPNYKAPEPVLEENNEPETFDFANATAAEEEMPKIKKWNKTETAQSVETFLNVRSMLQAELFAMIAATGDKSKYEYTEEQMNQLARVYMPYAEKFGGKIPDWVWLLMVEGITTGKILFAAYSEGKINRANKRALKNPALKTVFKQAAEAEVSTERKNFEVDDDGFYKKNLKNVYVKQALRNEKASLNDLKGLLRDNALSQIKHVFPDLDTTPYEKFPNE